MPLELNMKIFLASKSPRRREILENLGIKFEIITADCDEQSDLSDAGELVMSLAEKKGRAVIDKLGSLPQDTLIIACDTLVYASGQFLGKPQDEQDARRMLSLLSGKGHEVVSGIYLCLNGIEATRFCSTGVYFDRLCDKDIDNYIKSGEPFDKAGAYAVQGKASAFIQKIDGDYFNVVGLPVNLLCKTLRDCFNINIFDLG